MLVILSYAETLNLQIESVLGFSRCKFWVLKTFYMALLLKRLALKEKGTNWDSKIVFNVL
jgi:hypothetical protein